MWIVHLFFSLFQYRRQYISFVLLTRRLHRSTLNPSGGVVLDIDTGTVKVRLRILDTIYTQVSDTGQPYLYKLPI